MRLLLATGLYPPESGGPATYTKLLEERLPARGVAVSVLPFREVRHLPKIFRHASYAWRCVRMARHADVIYAQDTVSVGFPAALAALISRKTFLVRVPGDYAWEQSRQRFGVDADINEFQKRSFGLRTALLRAVQKFVVRRACMVVVPSEYMRGLVAHWGVPHERIVRIYNGVELPVPTMAPLHRPAGFLVVTVARLVPWKGIDRLISVVAQEPEWSLVVVDDGPQKEPLQALAKKLEAESRVYFVGRLPRAQALGWVAAADAFVLNSTYEGLSHLLIEAMSLGVPIVATRVGGNPELLGEEGLLVPPKDDAALHAALKVIELDPPLAKRRGEYAAERAKQFSIESTVAAVAELLKRL